MTTITAEQIMEIIKDRAAADALKALISDINRASKEGAA